jgi:type IV pilus assembly protein PilY1
MFRPDAAAGPRWVGNLKQYQLGLDANGDLLVETSTGAPALNAGTGYFDPLAVSFWTSPSVFFANSPSGAPLSPSSDSPDGQIVEKGGVAEILRTANLNNSSPRKVYTLPANAAQGTQLSSYPFSSANSAVTGFGFTTAQINWVRGENNIAAGQNGAEYMGSYQNGTNVTSLAAGSARPSIHGDILHSRPVALNYGNARVVVYYGSNDGFLRAVDGRKDTTLGGGSELWSFVAPEHYGMLMRLHDDTPSLWLPSTDSSGNTAPKVIATSQKKDYAMDGPIGSFAQYNTAGVVTQAMIFATMRRGGSAVYAFDVSDPTSPLLQWKISPSTGGFGTLGQTWSTPRAVVFPSSTGLLDPIIVMGGGYDPAEDTNTSSGVGQNVYVINGRTGALLKTLATDWSVPGDVTVVDTNGDGVYDRGYVSDVRGNVYRIQMTDASGNFVQPASWTIVKIASLGGKVFFAPDVIATRSFVAVLTGTGDREKPLMTTTSDNFFLIKDVRLGEADRANVLTISDLTRVARVDNATHQMVDVNTTANSALGCYLQLATNGEKVVNAPTSVSGATYFGTNTPTPNNGQSCTGSLGEARSYQFPLFCGVPSSTVLEGGGLPPSPVGGLVAITNSDGSVKLVNFILGSGKSTTKSALEAWQPHSPIPNKRKRTYWHFENQNR